MKYRSLVIFFGLIFCLISRSYSFRCEKTPENVKPQINDNNFFIELNGSPETYVPLERYIISIKAQDDKRFKEFILSVEHDSSSYGDYEQKLIPQVGQIRLVGDGLSKFSDRCPNTVIQSNTLSKDEVKISWHAPRSGSGCIVIKAVVVEAKEIWFSDEGPLQKRLCEETSEDEDVQPKILSHCCACDEAKYEIAFEGLWTRNTHPKDFPSDIWTTKFSDVIGASHSNNYSFWEYGGIANDGLARLSLEGITKNLEGELKEMSEHIRTIIKARGVKFPNITSKSFAVFRVDNKNHLVSIASKIIPSPDWIVGVSKLELCTRDCKWVDERVLNLYPWDAGTDDGLSYESPRIPLLHKQPIRRIKSNSPNDPSSPFYSDKGEEIKPLARLYLIRQRLYEKPCTGNLGVPLTSQENEISSGRCAATEWSDWSPCSQKCGHGIMFRSRTLINTDESNDECDIDLVEQQSCFGRMNCRGGSSSSRYNVHVSEAEGNNNNNNNNVGEETEGQNNENTQNGCELENWGEWSNCSAVCGRGSKTRDRVYKYPDTSQACPEVEMQKNEICMQDDCGTSNLEPSYCFDDSKWEKWTSCSVNCGVGFKERKLLDAENDRDFRCKTRSQVVECYKECNTNRQGQETSHSNPHNMDSESHVIYQGSTGPVIDCQVSDWSDWNGCVAMEGDCGRGYRTKTRHITEHPHNGGSACPKKLQKRISCTIPCDDQNVKESGEATTELQIDCIMGRWSAWSPCSNRCGTKSVQQRTRSIRVYPTKNGRRCGHRKEERLCPLPNACPNDPYLISNYFE